MGITPGLINLDDTTPAASTGKANVGWQAGAPFSTTIVFNGQTIPVMARNVSAQVLNLGKVDPRTTTSETIALADQGKLVTLANASPIAVTLDSTVPNTFMAFAQNIGAASATLTPSSGMVNGAADLVLTPDSGAALFFDGTNWYALVAAASTVPLFADSETPSGSINGANKTFTLAHTPSPAASLILVQYTAQGGITLIATVDYTLSGNTLTLTNPPVTGDGLYAWYRH